MRPSAGRFGRRSVPDERARALGLAPDDRRGRPMSAAPFWALDARDPDDLGCWIDVPDRLNGGSKACNQPPAPDSTLCAGHRALLTDTTAGAR